MSLDPLRLLFVTYPMVMGACSFACGLALGLLPLVHGRGAVREVL